MFEETRLLVLVGHHIPRLPIGTSCKSKPKWVFVPHAKSTNSHVPQPIIAFKLKPRMRDWSQQLQIHWSIARFQNLIPNHLNHHQLSLPSLNSHFKPSMERRGIFILKTPNPTHCLQENTNHCLAIKTLKVILPSPSKIRVRTARLFQLREWSPPACILINKISTLQTPSLTLTYQLV